MSEKKLSRIEISATDGELDMIADLPNEEVVEIRHLLGMFCKKGGEASKEEYNARTARHNANTAAANDMPELIRRIRNLEERDLKLVVSLLDLLGYGSYYQDGINWLRTTIVDILQEVEFAGPGPANERSGYWTILEIIENHRNFMEVIDDAKGVASLFPKLFEDAA